MTDGGAIYMRFGSFDVRSCLLVGNSANREGGALFYQDRAPSVRTSTLASNVAGTQGGAIGTASNFQSPRTRNSIFWQNIARESAATNHSEVAFSGSSTHSILSGGTNLNESHSSDPEFVRVPDSGDGDWTTAHDNDYGDLRLQISSPAMNSGLNREIRTDRDAAGAPRIVNRIVDRGAHEHQTPITFASTFPGLDPNGDEDKNGRSNFFDYAIGSDPTDPLSLYHPKFEKDALFSSTIRRISSDVIPLYQRSTNLIDWESMKVGIDYRVSALTFPSPDHETTTIKILTEGPVQFVRQVIPHPTE